MKSTIEHQPSNFAKEITVTRKAGEKECLIRGYFFARRVPTPQAAVEFLDEHYPGKTVAWHVEPAAPSIAQTALRVFKSVAA
jgi:hypothetical protein